VLQIAHFRESNTQIFGQGEIKLLLLRVNQSLKKGQTVSTIKFDPDAIRRLGQQIAIQVAPAAQQSVEGIGQRRSGKSVERIMSELRSELATSNVLMSDQELRRVAASIVSGQRVTVRGS
jgi:ATP-dependent protease HslVU (ClpYQ) ATPase subunit